METWKAKKSQGSLEGTEKGARLGLQAFKRNYRAAVMKTESHPVQDRHPNRTESEPELPSPDIGGYGKQEGQWFQ